MTDIIKLEKTLFSSLHSKFQKLLNQLNNSNKNSNNYLNKILLINKQILILENMINELKYDIIKDSDNLDNLDNSDELNEHLKDIDTIEVFKPYMLYYRLLLDN